MSHRKNLETHGYTIVKNYLDKGEIEYYLAEVERIAEKVGDNTSAPPAGAQKIIQNDRIINNIHFHSEAFFDLISYGKHIEILSPFLNDEWYGLIPQNRPNFILAQCNCRESSTALPYHVDVRLKSPGHQSWSMQCILALGDRHKENGGLKVIDGSHKNDRLKPNLADLDNEVFVDLEEGDMVIFHSHLIHATTQLQDGRNPGWGLLLTYRSWWCKPQFDFMEMFSKERIEKYDDIKKTLLGYYSQPDADCFGSPSARKGYS